MTRGLLAELNGPQLTTLDLWWPFWAREDQMPPDTKDWRVWLVLGGRGAGKTRTGAQWVRSLAMGEDFARNAPARRIALIGETAADVRDVMIEGVSGILMAHRYGPRPIWEPSRRRLTWPNGAIAQAFSADEPDQLRGPQFDAAWADELAKWRHPDATFDTLQMALRLGVSPRLVVTTTPRPLPLVKRLIRDPATVVSRARTADNARFLAEGFMEEVQRRYGGTRLGRQELDGEILEDREDALWTRAMIEAARVLQAPALGRVVVGVDPPASDGPGGACGIVAVGLGADGRIYVLEDATVEAARPARWAEAVVQVYHRHAADRIIAEVNQGGDMVEAVLREVDASIAITKVRAARGKWIRAEPVAALYEQQKVAHLGYFSALEDQMCDFSVQGLSGGRSPDRLDALVWAITALNGRKASPQIRSLK